MDLLDLTFLLYTIKVHRESKDREEVDRYEVEKLTSTKILKRSCKVHGT